jgi:hypothetical protein
VFDLGLRAYEPQEPRVGTRDTLGGDERAVVSLREHDVAEAHGSDHLAAGVVDAEGRLSTVHNEADDRAAGAVEVFTAADVFQTTTFGPAIPFASVSKSSSIVTPQPGTGLPFPAS